MRESRTNWSEFLVKAARSLLILALAGFIIFVLYGRFAGNSESFEGVIVDKWVNLSETQQGSYAYRIILVRTNKDAEIKIRVDAETYERARIGHRMKREADGIININSQMETNR